MNIKPLGNKINFVFIDDIIGEHFEITTTTGIIIKEAALTTANENRWGKVLAVGNEVNTVKVGDYILIEKLKWTNAVHLPNNEKFWQTDEEQVLAISETPVNNY